MDFVISKVAMSICALLVAGILATAVGADRLADSPGELEGIAQQFCELADAAMKCGSEGSVVWTVPSLSNGSPVTVTIGGGIVRTESCGSTKVMQPLSSPHTWTWNGSKINESVLKALDDGSARISVVTGDRLLITTDSVPFGSEERLLVFVRAVID